MSEHNEVHFILQRMEQNQLESLAMQAEQLALVKAGMERTELKVQESIALQRVANARQARALNVLFPIILAVLVYLGYRIVNQM